MQHEDFAARLERIEALLSSLVDREQVREWYSTEEFARLMGKAEFTVREYCRRGRIHAEKRQSGRGKHHSWVISHDEMLRYRRDGLLPFVSPLGGAAAVIRTRHAPPGP